MKPSPEECEIVGSWIFEGGQVEGDDNCRRIDWLIYEYLEEFASDDSSWGVLFVDPHDQRCWELLYDQHPEMHGGGPPRLVCLSPEVARAKYRLNEQSGGSSTTEAVPRFPDWGFDVDEVSAGVYRARARDARGREIEKTGDDVEALLHDVRSKIREFEDRDAQARDRDEQVAMKGSSECARGSLVPAETSRPSVRSAAIAGILLVLACVVLIVSFPLLLSDLWARAVLPVAPDAVVSSLDEDLQWISSWLAEATLGVGTLPNSEELEAAAEQRFGPEVRLVLVSSGSGAGSRSATLLRRETWATANTWFKPEPPDPGETTCVVWSLGDGRRLLCVETGFEADDGLVRRVEIWVDPELVRSSP